MINKWMTYSATCDLCKDDYKCIKENLNYDTFDFKKELEQNHWLVDDIKTICPKCKTLLERIKML